MNRPFYCEDNGERDPLGDTQIVYMPAASPDYPNERTDLLYDESDGLCDDVRVQVQAGLDRFRDPAAAARAYEQWFFASTGDAVSVKTPEPSREGEGVRKFSLRDDAHEAVRMARQHPFKALMFATIGAAVVILGDQIISARNSDVPSGDVSSVEVADVVTQSVARR